MPTFHKPNSAPEIDVTVSVGKPQRIPIVRPDGTGIDESWTDGNFTYNYNSVLTMHPSINHPGEGIWTVTHAPTGQGILHLPSQEEAAAFALWLLAKAHKERAELGFQHFAHAKERTKIWFSRKCVEWGTVRASILPKESLRTTPAGIVVPGWEDRLRKAEDHETEINSPEGDSDV
jgi:hypothetical protein